MNALVLTDIQNDFLPTGALAVPDGDQVVPVANRLIPHFDLVVATQDWHPPDHESFASQHPGRALGETIELHGVQQILWPDHCVQNTPGAEFVPGLKIDRARRIFHKGVDRDVDSYSTFFDNAHRRDTGLGAYLREMGAQHVYLVGLALDFCVKFSALDAIRLGFDTHVVLEGTRPVHPERRQETLDELRKVGVKLVHEADVLTRLEGWKPA